MSMFSCPQCGSHDTQKYEAIWMNGTASGSVDGGGGSVSSFSQTNLARMAGPPTRATTWEWILGWTLVGGLALGPGGAVLGAAVGLVGAGLGVAYNIGTWRRLYADWQQSWYCHRCTHSFVATVGDRSAAA